MPYLVSSQELQNKTPKHLGQVARNWYLSFFPSHRIREAQVHDPFLISMNFRNVQQDEYPNVF